MTERNSEDPSFSSMPPSSNPKSSSSLSAPLIKSEQNQKMSPSNGTLSLAPSLKSDSRNSVVGLGGEKEKGTVRKQVVRESHASINSQSSNPSAIPSKSSHKKSRPSVSFKIKGKRSKSGESTSRPTLRKMNKMKPEESRDFRSMVEQAIRGNKVFSIDPTPAYAQIRRSLVQRGWVEKTSALASLASNPYSNGPPSLRPTQTTLTDSFLEDSKQAWISRALNTHPPDFIWSLGRHRLNFLELTPHQLVNQFAHSSMTTKIGITAFLQNSHWVNEAGTANTYFPRCYRLSITEERRAFISDFYLTACIALLQWVVGAFERDGETGIVSNEGKVDASWVDFCVKQIESYVKVRRHEDIDWTTNPYVTMPGSWHTFLEHHRYIASERGKLRKSDANPQALFERAKVALGSIAPFWPQLNIDGVKNLWICKPGAASRGNGIEVTNNLSRVLHLMAPAPDPAYPESASKRSLNWVVQKYIERPLLIYKTKFDIRQWFIVQDWNPMSVWFYRECYLRFSSQIFTLDDLHRSIHLCNNVVQRNFKNTSARDPALPEQNMWDNYTFQAYLKSIGKERVWEEVIYPGMKRAILGVLLAGQDSFEFRPNCFELYGADFMITEDFLPWLIEINGSPTMAASTTVTARLRNQVLEDCIKVVVDHRRDPKAPTGMFELIYKQNHIRRRQSFQITDVALIGKKLLADGKSFATSKPGEPKSLHGIVFSGEIPATLSFPEGKSLSRHSVSSRLSPEHLIKRFQLSDLKLQPPLVLPSKLQYLSNVQLAQGKSSEYAKETANSSPNFPQNPFETKEKHASALNIPNIPPNIQPMHRLRSGTVKNFKSILKGADEAPMLTYESKETPSSGSSNNNSKQPSKIFTHVKEAQESSNGNSGETSPLKTVGVDGGLNKAKSDELRPKLLFPKETGPVAAKPVIVTNVPTKSSAALSNNKVVKHKRKESRTFTSKRPSVKTKVSFSSKTSQKIFLVQEKDSNIQLNKKPDSEFSSLNPPSPKIAAPAINPTMSPSAAFVEEMKLTARHLKRNQPPGESQFQMLENRGQHHSQRKEPGSTGPSSLSLKSDQQKMHGSTGAPEVLFSVRGGNESIRTSKIKADGKSPTKLKLIEPTGENQKRKAFILKQTTLGK